MTKLFLFLAAAAIVAGGGYWYMNSTVPAVTSSPQDANATTSPTDTSLPPAATASADASTTAPAPAATSTPTSTTQDQAITNTNQKKYMQATLHTSLGDITIEFDAANAPNTVANFVKLAQSGYYDGTKFHRVIKGFMDQGGDPLTKDDSMMARWGTGGPGYQFADENVNGKNYTGVVSMANAGPNTNGSQFFINAANNSFLDGKYSVFGKVTAGLEVAMAINSTPTDSSDRPITSVVITSVTLK